MTKEEYIQELRNEEAMRLPKLSATQSRAQQAEIEIAFQSMCLSHPLSQAEIIVRHYLSLFNVTHQTLAAMQTVNVGEPLPQSVRDFINHNIELIKKTHAKDLGIELKWEIPPAPGFERDPYSHFPQSAKLPTED